MTVAVAVGLVVLLGNLLVLAVVHGSALLRAQCPRCLSRDTYSLDCERMLCCDCSLKFGAAEDRPQVAA